MTKFEQAISILDKNERLVTIFLMKVMPGLGGATAVYYGAGIKAVLFVIAGFVFGLLQFFSTVKLATHDVGSHAEPLWLIRAIFIYSYFIGMSGVYLLACYYLANQIS